MNKVVLMGRLTRDPDIRYTQGEQGTAVAHYTLAVDRRFRRNADGQTADFIPCTVFGRGAEFAEKYFHKGIKIAVTGRIQTGSYTNRDGVRVYTTDVIVDEQEFAESKAASQANSYQGGYQNDYQGGGYQGGAPEPAQAPSPDDAVGDGFMNIPEGIDEELPFN